MNKIIIYLITAGMAITFINACGPSEEELRQQALAEQQARQDSLERVWAEEMEQMRQDSIEQARQDSIAMAEAAAEEEEERERERAAAIQYDSNGPFTVQVRSWRSEEKAEEHAEIWKERGFEHAYIEKYGDETIGDVWFRVRLGNVSSENMARQLQEKLKIEYDAESWVGNVSSRN